MPAAGAAWRSIWMVMGFFEHFAGELADFRGHGGGEEKRLAVRGEKFQDAADVGEEAHVQHAVGFVEDEDFQAIEAGVGLAEMVDEAAGGGDENFGAGTEGVGLGAGMLTPPMMAAAEMLVICTAMVLVWSRIWTASSRAWG